MIYSFIYLFCLVYIPDIKKRILITLFIYWKYTVMCIVTWI